MINLTLIIKSKIYPNKIADFMGYKPFIVLSGSMESNINIGDLVIVKETNVSDIKKEDIIAFRKDDIVITHRVIDTVEKDGSIYFKTKGDNNNTADEALVSENDLEGKYVFKIAGLGSVLLFFAKPLGMLIIILVIFLLALIVYIIKFKNNKEDAELMKEFLEYKKNHKD